MMHAREIADCVDLFIAPSRYIHDRFRDDFGLDVRKLVYLDYGFDLARLADRERQRGEPFTFGYIGTHIPAKGIHHLLEAFGSVLGSSRLRIWGRPRGQDTESLRAIATRLPHGAGARVEWTAEYRNQDIVRDVFNRVDCIVVPSIWTENSPLVIHEALQARVPVITANIGGMAEYVHHEVNGLLFDHRKPSSLAVQMQRLVDDPDLARQLGRRGYAQTESGDIPDIHVHVAAVEALYEGVLSRRRSTSVARHAGSWRITFDTNPDTCNLRCVMCEEHSPHSLLQVQRRAAGKPRRVMPIDLVRQIVAEAAPRGLREIIPSTMGEPLLYEHFDEILAVCREHGVKLNLTTNGTFPRLGAREWARRLVPVTSDVKISWNGARAETQESIMLGTQWGEVIENVRAFIAVRDDHAALDGNRCRVTFQLTFLESNVAELADIVRLAIDLGIDRVKGHHVWAHFAELDALSMRRSAESIQRWNAAVLAAEEAAAERRLPGGEAILLENLHPLDVPSGGDIARGGACPFLGQEAWVSAEGRFDPCCAPDAQRRTLGDFGSLHERSLIDIWNSDAYRRLTQTYASRSLCQGCNMRRPVVCR